MPYPDNMPSARRFTDELRCKNPECGHKWEAAFITDCGMTDFLNDGDEKCPECGAEGE